MPQFTVTVRPEFEITLPIEAGDVIDAAEEMRRRVLAMFRGELPHEMMLVRVPVDYHVNRTDHDQGEPGKGDLVVTLD